ncbi:MAG: FIG00636829: hypothetical protein [uncultured Sphingomonadaceae bacterium]|uniref:Gll1812 protein n=1 Tax=uncultured Sphingomonadaceae bacterium TaxID=169976 RepID=A0A6J4SMD0_9SPHN|nr:MAG: FIG00636829: hypothetical protein [uncultured Sphingomonadaceae bacterium]
MATGVEELGTAVEGGLLARAAEPRAGEPRADGRTAERACLNCRTQLVGEFCHGCGQHAHVHRTLGAFGHDLLHGVLHLEGKLWRTLPKLMFRPGELTRRYVEGERARFVSPLAVFLFSVFLMFASVSLVSGDLSLLDEATRAEAADGVKVDMTRIDAEIARLRRERTAATARGAPTGAIDEKLRDAALGRSIMAGIAGEDQAPDADRSGLKASGDARADVGLAPNGALDKAWRAAKANPTLLAYKLQTNAYKFSWALILISVPFVWLLFLWRRRPLYDHIVFVTYSIAAVSVLVIVGSLLVAAGAPAGVVISVATLFVPWHMYRQLRGAYGLRRFSALWRTAALAAFANVALTLFAVLVVAMGATG